MDCFFFFFEERGKGRNQCAWNSNTSNVHQKIRVLEIVLMAPFFPAMRIHDGGGAMIDEDINMAGAVMRLK